MWWNRRREPTPGAGAVLGAPGLGELVLEFFPPEDRVRFLAAAQREHNIFGNYPRRYKLTEDEYLAVRNWMISLVGPKNFKISNRWIGELSAARYHWRFTYREAVEHLMQYYLRMREFSHPGDPRELSVYYDVAMRAQHVEPDDRMLKYDYVRRSLRYEHNYTRALYLLFANSFVSLVMDIRIKNLSVALVSGALLGMSLFLIFNQRHHNQQYKKTRFERHGYEPLREPVPANYHKLLGWMAWRADQSKARALEIKMGL